MATLLASIVAAELGADCCVLEAGGVRGNATYEASLTFAHLRAELPFENLMAVVPVDGASLSAFVRDSRDRPDLRSPRGYAFVLHGDVGLAYCPERKAVTTVRGEPLDPDRLYTVATCVDLGFGSGKNQGSKREAKFPTSKPHISAVFHSFRLIFGRAIISRNGLEAWMLFPERARAEHSC
ncbi:hypothetical protein JL720_3551 [Aureococcus anophagefferens]|nr:hypothetical protein JL720_3551 [Aureococcus anophagefferens]